LALFYVLRFTLSPGGNEYRHVLIERASSTHDLGTS